MCLSGAAASCACYLDAGTSQISAEIAAAKKKSNQ